jgi:anti-sigma regulatory factor (Ser/Thr protein kinase)/CheY-like chemotaxis protein
MDSVLLVDRDPEVHAALTPEFSGRGWRVESSFDARAAMTRIQAEPFSLVVADAASCEAGDPCEWLRRARVLRPGMRILVTAATSTPSHVICALRENAFAWFGKPFTPRAVADMAAQALATPQWSDDIEVISAAPHWITLRVRCKPENADRLVHFLREMKIDLSHEQREDISAALRELLLNAIEHGARSDPAKRMQVSYIRTGRALVYHIQDPGPGFSLENIVHAAVGNPESDPVRHLEVREEMGVRPGGFGILLTRHLADELIYNEKGNEVLFIKYLKD